MRFLRKKPSEGIGPNLSKLPFLFGRWKWLFSNEIARINVLCWHVSFSAWFIIIKKNPEEFFYLKHRRIQNKKEDFEYWFQWILISNRWFLAKLWTTLEISRNVWKFVLWNIENNGIMIERSFNGSRRLWHEQKKWSQTDGHFKVIWVRQIILRT